MVVVHGQLKDEQGRQAMRRFFLGQVAVTDDEQRQFDNMFSDTVGNTGEHVLTDSRRSIAASVGAAVACRRPVLLEGPAAVGKTSLVTALANEMVASKPLLRVNNTDTTTVQDYIGTFVPQGSSFEYQRGALYRAVEDGHWMLADEFNLVR